MKNVTSKKQFLAMMLALLVAGSCSATGGDSDDTKNRNLIAAALCPSPAGGDEPGLDAATRKKIKKLKGAVGRFLTVTFDELQSMAETLSAQRRPHVRSFLEYKEWRGLQDLDYYIDLLQQWPATSREAERFIEALQIVRDNLAMCFARGFEVMRRFEQAVHADLVVQQQKLEQEAAALAARMRKMQLDELDCAIASEAAEGGYDQKARRSDSYDRRSKRK